MGTTRWARQRAADDERDDGQRADQLDASGQVRGGATLPRFGYTGELQDAATGQVYLRARWYSSASGCFGRRDTYAGEAEEPQSLHRYAYVHNDPINATDPTGLWRWRGASDPYYHAIIEDVHLWRSNQTDVHVEFNDHLGRLSVDVVHSNFGDVYEIEPVYNAAEAIPQAFGYVRLLNEIGLHAARYGGIPRLNGFWRGYPKGSISRPGVRYDWNHVQWTLGNPANFPPIRILGWDDYLAPNGAGVADLVAASPAPGVVLYWLEPNARTAAGVAAFAAAAWLARNLKRYPPPFRGPMPPVYVPGGVASGPQKPTAPAQGPAPCLVGETMVQRESQTSYGKS